MAASRRPAAIKRKRFSLASSRTPLGAIIIGEVLHRLSNRVLDAGGERPGFWWDELNLPGAAQMTHLKALMQEVPWWALEPHPEWVSTPAAMSAYCAAVPRQVYLVYSAGGLGPLVVFIAEAEGEPYDGRWFDPRAGTWREAEGAYAPYGSGWVWRTTTPDEADWVLLLKRRPAA